MMTRVLLSALALALLCSCAQAETAGIDCTSNDDCSDGATCVAGDSSSAVQQCVAGAACGGSISGNCPSDSSSGQLACIWREDAKTCATSSSSDGCKELSGSWGIYKCISIDRCDEYYGDNACSGSCNYNGTQCNGRGNCELTSYTDGTPSFSCSCDSGWNGTTCETVVNASCVAGAGNCGSHGTCVDGSCSCLNGYTGDQCQIAPSSSSSGSTSIDASTSSDAGSVKATNSGKDAGSTTAGSKLSASSSGTSESTSSSNSSSSTFIVIGVLAALIVIAALLFALYSRKKKREQEEAGGFSRASSIGSEDELDVATPDTPKQKIVVM